MKEKKVREKKPKEEVKVDTSTWIPGTGNDQGPFMIIIDRPSEEDQREGVCLGGKAGDLIRSLAREHQFDLRQCYFTYAVKFRSRSKSVPAKEIKLAAPYLREEIKRINPRFIVALGKTSLETLLEGHDKMAMSEYRGILIDYPDNPAIKIFPTFSPGHVLMVPTTKHECDRDWRILSLLQQKGKIEYDVTETFVINTVDDLKLAIDTILQSTDEQIIVSIDAEWHGKHWLDPDGYIRTFQFTAAQGMGIVVEFFDENKNPMMDNAEAAWDVLREFLQNPRVVIIGQNVIADGEWLLSYGIDIRERVVYDTMLAEHTINPQGPFGLEVLTVKYTNLGRYDQALLDWKRAGGDTDKGYGKVPRDILNPYGAADVDAPLRIMYAQAEHLKPFTEPRDGYPSLWSIVMNTQQVMYEIEMTGMLVDKERLSLLTQQFHAKLTEMETQLKIMAAGPDIGVEDFNFNSVDQVRDIIFNKLKIPPVKTTEGKPWTWVLDQDDEVAEDTNPSTDKTTLEILQDAHPFIKLMRDTRKIEHICRTWLRTDFDTGKYDETTKGGGIIAKIWPDGKLHARFSQLKETGRFSSSKPNVQNWPKRAEGDIAKIFAGVNPTAEAKKKIPASIKTVIIPEPGHVLIEGDWKQAELFVLAYLSGDSNMVTALTTPGKDLHDITTIRSFNIKVSYPDGREVVEQDLLDLAKKDKKAFKRLQETLLYTDQRGKIMDRETFKETIRVSGKNIGFGIPYGRGAEAIAIQVKAETGSDKTIQELQAEIQRGIDLWKNELYPAAWQYMLQCSRAVTDPGYLVNPWGRVRPFPYTLDRRLISDMGREAQNWPIQSTVADTCMLAFKLIGDYRAAHNLHFTIVNQIHDAIIFQVPINEIEATTEMIHNTMGNIRIPMPEAPLVLDVDIKVMDRWGEKKEE